MLCDKSCLNLYRQLTLNEIQKYRKARRTDREAVTSISSVELTKLNTLIRLLKKSPINLQKVLSHVADLQLATKHFLDFEVKKLLSAQADESSRNRIANSLEIALAALEYTRAYFREPSGSRYSQAQLDLVRALANIYKTASGKKIGVGSSSTTLGSDYMTPSEHFLYAALKLANKHTTIEGMRELYRAANRQKKGAKKPVIKKKTTLKNKVARLG